MVQDSPPDSTDPDLRDRVAELEATVEQQQETIQQLLPSRRRVLQAGGLLAGGGVLGAVTADRAAADAAGQVGTLSKPLDVIAYSIQDRNGDSAFISVAASGSVQLSSGSATVTVDSNPPSGATYSLAIGPTQNAKISGRAFNDGDLKVELVETDTSVGNPTVPYDVIRVR